MRIFSPHCPNCGARVSLADGANRATCEYCGGTLILSHHSVTHVARAAPPPTREEKQPSFPAPDAVLSLVDGKRFELSMLEQKIEGSPSEKFVHLELTEDRFALVYLRAIDQKGKGISADLETPFAALKQSLEDDGDPGLAANVALEAAAAKSFTDRLECAVLLFNPKSMTLLAYDAGCREALWWVSQEEGRAMTAFNSHDPLERKMLKEARDHFSNSQPIRFAAGDLFVLVSAGYANRGGSGYSSGTRPLIDALNAHLGEDPLRVVTLAKNAFWDHRSGHDKALRPSGDIRVAAVRARLPELRDSIGGKTKIEVVRSKKFSVALARQPGDAVEFLPLHSARHVVIWLSGELPPDAMKKTREAVLGVLDRKDHGDNDNPRRAGREAYAAIGADPARVRMAVIQLFDQFERVKYFRGGWHQPIAVGPRGIRDAGGIQQFDEGGEASVYPGGRLLFTGALPYDGDTHSAEDFAALWHGGKASLLYEALRDHWKTKKAEKALEKILKAGLSDAGADGTTGVALVTNESA